VNTNYVEDDQETTPTELIPPTTCSESAVEEVAKLFNQLKTRKPSDSPNSSSSVPVTPSPSSFPHGKPMLTMIRRKLKARKKSSLLKEATAGGGGQAPKARSLFKASGSGSGGIWESTAQAWSSGPVGAAETDISTSTLFRELVEELGVGQTLMNFLRDLPVVKELSQSCSNGDLSSYWKEAVGAEEGDVNLPLLIKK